MPFCKSVGVVGASNLGLFANGKSGGKGNAMPYIAITAGISLGALIWVGKKHPGYLASFLVGAGVAKVDSVRKEFKKSGHRSHFSGSL